MKRLLPPSLALLALSACGGGSSSSSPHASALAYVNPAGTSGNYALVKDPASTGTQLVLDVVGPEGSAAVGVTFGFDVDAAKAAWAAAPVANGTLFGGSGANLLCQGWVSQGRLQGIAANRGLAFQVSDIGASKGVLARITLTPASGAAAGTVALSDNGLATVLASDGVPQPIRILVGTLTLQ